jgi:integrase
LVVRRKIEDEREAVRCLRAAEQGGQNGNNRLRIRAHDLRATFVTLAFANGRSEDWVMQRTGHSSSVMLARYRRDAKTAQELGLGWLLPLHEAIPELRILNDEPGSSAVESSANRRQA